MGDTDLVKAVADLRSSGINSLSEISRRLEIPHSTLKRRVTKLGLYVPDATSKGSWTSQDFIEYEKPAEPVEITAEELLEQRAKQFLRKKKKDEAYSRQTVKVNLDGPIGICHFGDCHLDNAGTNIPLVQEHISIVNSTEGMMAATVGDTTDNWIGSLKRLYAESHTTEEEAWILAEWFFNACPWLYIIGGNHDCWSGAQDPLKWITKHANLPYQPSSVILSLKFPNGRTASIDARHQFPGHSMWNTAHGAGKALQMGEWSDIAICGHKHVSGRMVLKAPDGRICHAIQLASYKEFDSYAKEKGFRDQNISPAVVTVIDPYADRTTNFITVFEDVAEGAEFLTYKRSKYLNG